MDSVTQAVLGASVGELFLGRKLGNRAMAWGAAIGTLPDLDVVSRLFLSHEVYGLIYHRGLSHSILLTIVLPFLLAFLAQSYYARRINQIPTVQNVFAGFWLVFYALFLLGGLSLAFFVPTAPTIIIALALSAGGYFWYKSTMRERINGRTVTCDAGYWRWYWMFFFGIFTHWFIDACTAYGTQIFEPFSSYRVAFNNISIVDPLYTLPFLVFLAAVYFSRTQRQRQFYNGLALGLSSAYMAFTFYAKHLANTAAETSLATSGIAYKSYMTTPTMFNTILWQIVAETEDKFYYGTYSLFDKKRQIDFIELQKNHELVKPYEKEPLVEVLLWFAQGYYTVVQKPDGTLRFYNLRFGLTFSSADAQDARAIIGYSIGNHNGKFDVWQSREEMENLNFGKTLEAFWERLKGLD